MEIPKLKFTKLWTNHDDFPTVETREEVVRSDMQLLFNEIRDYINATLSGVVSTLGDTLTALQGKAGAGRIGFTRTAAIDRENVQDAIECVQEQLVNVSQGGIADGAVTSEKVAAGAIGTAAIADAAVTYVGDTIRKLYPGQITYNDALGSFIVPVTQEETFDLPEGETIRVDVRVQFPGGMVLGVIDELKAKVADAISEEVL